MENKALVFLAARNGKVEALHQQLPAVAEQLFDTVPGNAKKVTAMASMQDDSFRFSAAPVRAYDATIELKCAGDSAESVMLDALSGLGDKLENCIFADLSALLVGSNRVFIDNAPTPIRYQYLMRRRHDFSHDQYLERYRDIHSQFGLETGGIEGYHQFHVNPGLSQRACQSADFGIWAVDSVSELHIDSMDAFLAAVGSSDTGARAAEDEEKFVDRPNSVMFTSREILQLGY